MLCVNRQSEFQRAATAWYVDIVNYLVCGMVPPDSSKEGHSDTKKMSITGMSLSSLKIASIKL